MCRHVHPFTFQICLYLDESLAIGTQLFFAVEDRPIHNFLHHCRVFIGYPLAKRHQSIPVDDIFINSNLNLHNFETKVTSFKFFLVFLCFIQIYVLHLRLSFGKYIGISVR